jgi:hypothetical protein
VIIDTHGSLLDLPLVIIGCLTGASCYGHQVERTSNKLPSSGQGKSLNKLFSSGQGRCPLKYTNYGVCMSLERRICFFEESLDFH